MPAPSPVLPTVLAPAEMTGQEAIAAARRLRARVLDEAAETERRTFPSEGLHAAFVEAGFFHLLRPRRYGGYEASVADFMRVIREIGRGDMATAWCLALAAGHVAQAAAWFPSEVQDEIFTPDTAFAASYTSAPSGTLTPVEGGFRHSGRHAYSSGIPFATHVMGVARHDDGSLSTFIAPRADVTVLDDWGRTLGLKGSGSHTVVFDDVFLPASHVLVGQVIPEMPIVRAGAPGLVLHRSPLYTGRSLAFFGLEIANALAGAARGALDEYEAFMPEKRISLPPFSSRADDPTYRGWFGRIQIELLSAEAVLDRAADLLGEYGRRAVDEGPDAFTLGDDYLLHGLAKEGLDLAWGALQRIVGTVGSSAVTEGARLERIVRDATMAWGHLNSISSAWSPGGYAAALFSGGARGI